MKKSKLCAAILAGFMLSASGNMLYTVDRSTSSSVVEAASKAKQVKLVKAVVAENPSSVKKEKGVAVYKTINEALTAMAKQPAKAYQLNLEPGVYREKVKIDLPNFTLVGREVDNTIIVWNDAEGTPLRPGDTNGDKTTYTMECATVKVTENATNFQAVNILFMNDFPTEERRADKTMKNVQAFALTCEADKSSFYNCYFYARQDTLYANAGRQYYQNCQIEGDVDFIFGQASAAVFENCEIRSLMRAVKDDGSPHSTGYIVAPSTLATDKGFLFYHCHLTSDIEAPHYAMLGRPWHPSSEKREVNSAAAFVRCQIDTPMKAKAWNSMKNKYGVFLPEDNRLFEYENSGSGALTSANRRQLTEAQAADYTPAKFLGDWKPQKRA